MQLAEPLARNWQAHYRRRVRWCTTGSFPENLCLRVLMPGTFGCASGSTKLMADYGGKHLKSCFSTLNDGTFDCQMCAPIHSRISAKRLPQLNNAVATIRCSW